MLAETMALEQLRQKIEKAEYEAGDASDYIDHGNPNASQLKSSQELIARKNAEAKQLKVELHELLDKSSNESIQEWVDWHKNVLQPILQEQKDKTRLLVAKQTIDAWDKVLRREQEYVGINWYYLKDYKQKAEKAF